MLSRDWAVPDDLAPDNDIHTLLDATRDAVTSWLLAEHYDPALDSEHLVTAIYRPLRAAGVETLMRAVVLLLEEPARTRMRRIVADSHVTPAWLRQRGGS